MLVRIPAVTEQPKHPGFVLFYNAKGNRNSELTGWWSKIFSTEADAKVLIGEPPHPLDYILVDLSIFKD